MSVAHTRAAWTIVIAMCSVTACSLDLAGTSSDGGANPVERDGGDGAEGSAAPTRGGGGSEGGGGTPGSVIDAGSRASRGGGTLAGAEGGPEGGGAICGANGASMCTATQQCDPALGCVDCTSAAQCPVAAAFCLGGACVQCRTSNDCDAGTTPVCWPADHTCHAACMNDQQCQSGNGAICSKSTAACVGCESSADCPNSRNLCDPTTQQCVQCTSNSDCAGTATPACSRNRCAQCASNADCSGVTPYCRAGGDNGPVCVQCLQPADCPPSAPKCNGGTCGPPN